MAIHERVKEYLDRSGVSYEPFSHPKVFSCIEEAQALGIDAGEIAKTLVVKIKDKRALVVLPGSLRLDIRKLKDITESGQVRLLTEDEMGTEFPEFEIGAIPPLGELFGLLVYLDRRLLDHETIIFTGGTHTDSIKMKCVDLVNLVNPDIVDLAKED